MHGQSEVYYLHPSQVVSVFVELIILINVCPLLPLVSIYLNLTRKKVTSEK